MEMDAWLPGVARDCVGYVAADLQALVREAIVATASAQQEQGGEDGGGGGSVSITEAALRGAMERVGASVLRGKGLEVPHVPWSAIGACLGGCGGVWWDVGGSPLGLGLPYLPPNIHTHAHTRTGGQEEAKRRLQQALEWPLRYPKTLARFFSPPRAGEDGDGGNRGGGPLSATGNGILLYGPPGCAKTTLGA